MDMKLKYVVFFIIFVLLVFILWMLAFKSLRVTVVNKDKSDVCLADVKLGAINHLNNIRLSSNQDVSFFDAISFSDQLFVSYYRGACRDDSNLINLSCGLKKEGSDSCRIYIHSNGSLDCSECYK